MTAQNRATLKSYFQTGDTPTQAQFADTIDSFISLIDPAAQSIISDVSALGKLDVSGVFTVKGSAAASLTGNVTVGGSFAVSGATTLAAATGITRTVGDNTTNLATTAFVASAVGTAPTSSYVLLATTSANGAASVTFTNSVITSAYVDYEVRINGLFASVNVVDLLLTFSTNNGTSFLSSNYVTDNISLSFGGTVMATSPGPSTGILIFTSAAGPAVLSNSTGASMAAINITNLLVSAKPSVNWIASGPSATGAGGISCGNGANSGITPINAIRFTGGSSSTLTGNFNLWGRQSA